MATCYEVLTGRYGEANRQDCGRSLDALGTPKRKGNIADLFRLLKSHQQAIDAVITDGLALGLYSHRTGGMSGTVDEKFYQVIRPGSISERLLIRARREIFSDFIARMAPSRDDTILDVGVSDVINDGANVLEREYPYLEKITACGLGDAEDFQAAFPACHYHKIESDAPLPFPDRTFTIATANAVLEHVGSVERQISFVSELCRVADRVFISVPHRYFPVEHHTSAPFLHYNKHLFEAFCKITGKEEWTQDRNLILMARKNLCDIARRLGRSAEIDYTGLRLGPLSSNLCMSIR